MRERLTVTSQAFQGETEGKLSGDRSPVIGSVGRRQDLEGASQLDLGLRVALAATERHTKGGLHAAHVRVVGPEHALELGHRQAKLTIAFFTAAGPP